MYPSNENHGDNDVYVDEVKHEINSLGVHEVCETNTHVG